MMAGADLSLGIDLGTSGIRSAVLGTDGAVVSMARAAYPAQSGEPVDARDWWTGARNCIAAQKVALADIGIEAARIARIAVCGTSGSLVLTDARLVPVTRALMYHDGGLDAEAARIAHHAPDPHITRGSASALARLLRLLAEDTDARAVHLLHQADFVAATLRGRGGFSDHNNALKSGFDPEGDAWPDWFAALGVRTGILPRVVAAGSPLGPIAPAVAVDLGLREDTVVHAGTTDSIAAFLAAAPLEVGSAVTSLGTTLAVKMLCDRRIDAPALGLYSHRLGDGWLVGGASNTGGGVLRHFFDAKEIAALSRRIDPETQSGLDYYPLVRTGERFPVDDPGLEPRLAPRPADDADFLHGLFEGIARIEARCYDVMARLGAGRPTVLYTAGGGSDNPVWTAIRARETGLDIRIAAQSEAAVGVARLGVGI